MIRSPARIVGREQEIELLRSALAAARDGRGGLVLLSGEPGIGKSTLMAAMADEAAAQAMRVSFVRAPEMTGAPPYWLWTLALPELAPPHGEAFRPSPAVTEAERFRLADEIASLLRKEARDRGRLVVLDDLHAADASSLEVLTHVAGRLEGYGLLVMGAHRDAPEDISAALQSMLAHVSRLESTLRMALSRFDAGGVRSQLAGLIGRDVKPELAALVHARTGGNPFFTAEVASLIAQQGMDVASISSIVPTKVRDVITWRLQHLPDETRDVLDHAALIGQDIPVDVLGVACHREPTALLTALEPALRAGLLQRRSVSTRMNFSHALVAQTVAESLPLARAAALHREVAMAIEVSRASAIDDWLPALAQHWAAAASDERSSRRTLEVARLAAEQAEKRLAFADALAFWRMAMDASERAVSSPVTRTELRLGLARSLFRTGDVAAALDACLAAAADAEISGRLDLNAEAALVVEGVSEPQWAAMLIGLAESALRRLPSDDLARRARLHAQIGRLLHLAVPDSEEREQVETANAVRLAEQSEDSHAMLTALHAHQFVVSGPQGVDERLRNAGRMIRIAHDTGDPWPELWGRLWSVDALVQLGRLVEAEAEIHDVGSVVARLRWPVARWHVLRSRAAILQARGRFDEAVEHADRAVSELSGSGLERAMLTHVGFFESHAEVVGELPGGDERRRRLREAAAWEPGLLIWLVASLLRAGREEEAHEVHARMPPVELWNPPPYVLSIALRLRLQNALCLRLRDEVKRVSARLQPLARWHVTAGSGTFFTFGSGRLCTGMAAAFLGDLDGAVSEITRAADDNARCGAVTMSVVARQELAEVLVRRRGGTDLDHARRLASAVLEEAQRLGMHPYALRASALLRGMPRRRLKSEDLTARELQVAELVAEGLTNRQLAVRLGISERTVENHLDHIFTKLGVASRAQVAAWVAANGKSASPR